MVRFVNLTVPLPDVDIEWIIGGDRWRDRLKSSPAVPANGHTPVASV